MQNAKVAEWIRSHLYCIAEILNIENKIHWRWTKNCVLIANIAKHGFAKTKIYGMERSTNDHIAGAKLFLFVL